ncbi:MAG: leucine-rich repeat protein [Clostridia bacterium]|nr:leucine-rich repeat protein [Clostridia bacterium]
MKKCVTRAALILAALLLCAAFAGCDMMEAFKEGFSEGLDQDPKDQMFKDLKIEDTFADGKPYHLYFMSNGDGTCSVEYVTVDPENTQDFVIEIPEKSPTGDTVTKVDLHLLGYGKVTADTELLPTVISAAAFDALREKLIASDMKAFDFNKCTAYFLECTTEGLEGAQLQEMLDDVPFAQFGDVYVFDANASEAERQKILSYLTVYGGWTEADYEQSRAELLEMAKQCDTLEQAEACLSLLRNRNTEHVVGITFPKTVTAIGSDMWYDLKNLQNVTVDENNAVIKMVDGCLVNHATGTLLLCMNEGAILDNVGIQALGSYAFSHCELKLGEGGVREGIHLYIPEGVTVINPHAFTGMEIEDITCFTIHLPASLQTFAVPMDIWVYEYAGTSAEFQERITFTNVSKGDYLYIKTSDMEHMETFHIPMSK